MMNYKELSIGSYQDVRELWNSEVGFIFPITEKLFDHHVKNSPYLDVKSSFCAYIDEKLVGFIIGKKYDGDYLKAYKNRGWISLFYVAKKYRNMGIGSKLLEMSLSSFKETGKEEVWIGQDLGNFFPGIPADFDNLTANFLQKRGFDLLGYTHDLIQKEYQETECKENKYAYRFATIDDKEKLIEFMNENFLGRWSFELLDYYKNEKNFNNYYIALDNDKVIGFVRINYTTNEEISYNITWYDRFNNLVGIGPLGVNKEYRGQGVSKKMISNVLKYLHDNGLNEVLIDWTGLMVYYQQFGFEVFKCYMKCKKKL